MTTFKICIREENSRGFYPVYIRVIHNRKIAYIRTEKTIHKSKVVNKEIADAFLTKTLSEKIIEYNDLINKIDTSKLSVHQVVDFLKKQKQDICYSDYVRRYVREHSDMTNSTLLSYHSAINSLESYLGTNKIMVSYLTSRTLQHYVDYYKNKPKTIRIYFFKLSKLFKELMREVNDYDNNIIKVPHNPFDFINLPANNSRVKVEKAIPVEVLRRIFELDATSDKRYAIDICKLSFCLVGMNLVDIFNLKKENVKGDIISYERQKTHRKRKDNAYIEIKIPEIIKPIIEKYRDKIDSDYFFVFHQRATFVNYLTKIINAQLTIVAEDLQYDRSLTFYSFRHTWATISANDIGAGIEEVAFALNHVSAHEVTRGYVKADYSAIWRLNQRVLEFVFENKESFVAPIHKQQVQVQQNTNEMYMEYSHLLQITTYLQGRKLSEITDVGFSSETEVVEKVMQTINEGIVGSELLIKIQNLDTEKIKVLKIQL